MTAGSLSEGTQRPPLRVGDWLVDPGRLRISNEGGEQALEPRVMELLVYLAERPREVISAEQLLIDIWHGTFYGDGPVQRALAILRRCLGDQAQTPRYIETIRKRGYRLIADVVLPENYAGSVASGDVSWVDGSPYVGLRAFDAGHSSVFFGRARGTAAVLEAIRRQRQNGNRLVLLLGPSGCGKTSLLQAGVIPLLARDQGFDGLHAATTAWVDFADAPIDPLTQLAAALCQWQLGNRPIFLQRAEVERRLRAEPEAIGPAIESAFARWPSRAPPGQAMALLAIDHAEAVLTIAAADCAALNRAVGALAGCAQVLIVLLCRSDFYPGLLARFPIVAERKMPDGHVDLLPPTSGELAEIIRRPAQAAGLRFEKDPHTLVGLDDALRDAAVAHPEALPMLQYTLQALYEARGPGHLLSFAAYAALGGLEGALTQRAEQVYAQLPAAVQDAFVPLLEQLAISHESNRALTARRLPRSALNSAAEQELVDRLIGARLFTSSLIDDRAHFSVTHETLLRAWPRVQTWARDNERHLQIQQRVKQATRRWQQAGGRADLLLSRGLPLAEAGELVRSAPRLLDADDHALVQASLRADRKRVRRRWYAVVAALTLAAASVLFALQATRANELAEHRRGQAEQLIDYLLTDLANELRPLGRLALMDQIAHRALEHLSQLSEHDADDYTLLQRARALRTLGEVFIERGNQAAAERAFDQATLLFTTDTTHASAPQLLELGTLAYWQGALAFQRNQLDRAQTHFERYRALASELLRRQPDNLDWQLELSYALNNLGSLAKRRQDSRTALAMFKASAQIKEVVLKSRPGADEALAVDLADSLSWIGSALELEGRLVDASGYYQRQLELLRDVGVRAPTTDGWRHRLALAEVTAGNLDIAMDRGERADEHFRRASTAFSELVAADPSNKVWKRDWSYAQAQSAYLHILQGHPLAARDLLQQADARLRPLLAAADVPNEWRRLAMIIALRSAQAAFAAGANGDVLKQLDALLDGAKSLQQQAPDDSEVRTLIARVLIVYGDALESVGKSLEATASWEWASGLLEQQAQRTHGWRVRQTWVAGMTRLGRRAETAEIWDALLEGGYRLDQRSLP